MVDPETIEGIFRNLDQYLEQLQHLAQLPREDVINDPIRLGAAKYYLHVAIECCIDVANHIISRKGLRPPESYADSFTVLAENDVLDPDFATTARRMVKMRNRLVHLYWEIDAEIVYDVLQRELGDFRTFQRQISQFLQKHNPSQ